jgi:hypothetical protein
VEALNSNKVAIPLSSKAMVDIHPDRATAEVDTNLQSHSRRKNPALDWADLLRWELVVDYSVDCS